MATCKDCIGYEYCNPQPKNPRKVEKWCDRFKNKADFVEVVRCKDCQYRNTISCNAKHERSDMDYCSHGLPKGIYEQFSSYRERKEP